MEMKVLFLSLQWGSVRVFFTGSSESRVRPPIVALLGLLGMVLGEQLGIWMQTKKLDVPRAAAVCLVGERYDRQHSSQAA
jgi:xanthosine utilization system XapX-like protein